MSISIFYHPNTAFAPYSIAFIKIWNIGIVTSFLFAVMLSIFRKRFSLKGMLGSTAGVYGILLIIATVVMIKVKPVPDYFSQFVGDVEYRVP